MAKKYRLTGCAKFFIVLIFLIPISLFIASMVIGVDPVDAIKDAWQTEIVGKNDSKSTRSVSKRNQEEDLDISEEELNQLREDADFFEKESERLRAELDACQNAKQ